MTNISKVPGDTVKGRAIQDLAAAIGGANYVAALRLAANVADQETITIGNDAFEVHSVATDTTVNTASGELANTTAVVDLTVTAHGLTVGRILRVENEYMQISSVKSVDVVRVTRGYAGSTIASHANGADIYKGAQAVASGKVALPIAGTLTPTAASAVFKTGIEALSTHGVSVKVVSVNELLLSYPADAGVALACAETLAGVNNAIDAAFHGGLPPGSAVSVTVSRVPTAMEVALGNMHFVFPFTVCSVQAAVLTTATGAAVAWDGAKAMSGAVVTLDNAGTTDWAATDTVIVTVTGVNS